MSSNLYKVTVNEGELQGRKAKSVNGKEFYSFSGIPYAEPPVGDLRFKAPVQKTPWSGTLDATKEGNNAPQLDMFDRSFIGDEDCLFLNIHTPSLPKDNKDGSPLPVMVFIHGGAFLFMSGSTDWFTPDFIIESGVVFVSITFRLGVLGFLCLDSEEVPGNAGLKDQKMALKWIKENIKNFNGDPDNITLFGISSGAASVEYHLLTAPEGLFHKAIMQSGSSLNPWALTRNPTKTADKLLKTLDINEKNPQKILKLLQEMDLERIVSASFQVSSDSEYKNGDMFSFTPVVEKIFPNVEAFLDEEPLQLLKRGQFLQIPTISGFCSMEGFLFKTKFPEYLLKELYSREFSKFIPNYYKIEEQFNERLSDIYNKDDTSSNVDDFLSDIHFISGIYESVLLRTNTCQNDYLYQFSHDGKLNFLKSVFKMPVDGALHGDDSTYLSMSKYVDEGLATEDDKIVRQRMVKMWTDFAKYGYPTPETSHLITTKWPPVISDNVMILNIDKDNKSLPFPFPERMELWRNIYKT